MAEEHHRGGRARLMFVVVILASAPLAGCLGDDEGPEPPANDTGPNAGQTGDDAAAAIPAPSWAVGDHWTFETTFAPEVTYVVTSDQGSDWTMDTTNEQVAFFDAQSDISFLGPTRKGDLAGDQGGTPVKFFDFPLTPGSSWTTMWDGEQQTITVVGVNGNVASLEARIGDRLASTYTFDADAGWFGEVTFYAPDGTIQVEASLRSSGSGFSGEAVRWQLETVHDHAGEVGVPVAWGDAFEIGEGVTDLYLTANVTCPGQGAFNYGVSNQQDAEEGMGWTEPCPFELTFAGVVQEAPAPGTWNAGGVASSPAEPGHYATTVLARSLERVPVAS